MDGEVGRRVGPLSSRIVVMVLLVACGDAPAPAPARGPIEGEAQAPAVVFIGDSLTAGYGLDPEAAYPALIETRIREQGWDFSVVNAGNTGETTAGGRSRLAWLLRREIAVVVLALGGNDGLRGIPPDSVEDNLQAMIDAVRAHDPGILILLAGMQAPPNMGPEYTSRFAAIYPDLAERNDVPRVPFLLEGVGGEAHLNLPDGIHPNEAGQEVLANNVWSHLRPLLERLAEGESG